MSRHWAAELTRFLCLKPCRASNLLKLRSIRPRPLPRIVRVSFSVYPRHLARRAPCDQHDAPIQLREHTHRRPILSPLAFFCESFHLQSSTAVSVTTSMTPISLPIVYQCKRQCASVWNQCRRRRGLTFGFISIMFSSTSCYAQNHVSWRKRQRHRQFVNVLLFRGISKPIESEYTPFVH